MSSALGCARAAGTWSGAPPSSSDVTAAASDAGVRIEPAVLDPPAVWFTGSLPMVAPAAAPVDPRAVPTVSAEWLCMGRYTNQGTSSATGLLTSQARVRADALASGRHHPHCARGRQRDLRSIRQRPLPAWNSWLTSAGSSARLKRVTSASCPEKNRLGFRSVRPHSTSGPPSCMQAGVAWRARPTTTAHEQRSSL